MAIQTICDECSKVVPAEKIPVTLRMSRKTQGDILDMDLCTGCARLYLGIMKGTASKDTKVAGE